MRLAFVKTLSELSVRDKRITLITGDLGFSVFEDYIRKFPKQYLNAGVAEQNMTGVAAGMAIEGKIPIIYSIVPFVTMRNFEQIKNDICYQNLNVKIVGVGAGFSYGIYGHTHYGLEDVGILRTLPNMTIISPGDPVEVELAVKSAIETSGPVYIRLGKAGEPILHKKRPKFTLGKGIVLKNGKDVTLIGTGIMLETATKVMGELEKKRISTRLLSFPFIKPLDVNLIKKVINETNALFTLEEHSVIGGLGSAVSEVIAESGKSIIFKRFGAESRFSKVTGSQDYMRKQFGLGVDQITKSILSSL